MKANINDSQGIKKIMGSITFVDYPNGSYTVFVDNIHITTAYFVSFMGDDNQLDHGYDVVHVDANGQVQRIFTHDGLVLNYEKTLS